MTWVVDLTAPTVPSITQLATPTNNTSAAITFSAAETGGTVQCKLDAGDWGNCDSYNSTSKAGTLALASLTEGSHTVSVRQTDVAGNTGAAATMTWTVDLTAPDAPSITQTATPTNSIAPTIAFVAAETGGTVQCKLDSGSWGSCTSFSTTSKAGTWALAGLAEGSHTVSVRQSDTAGNTGAADTMDWVVDITAPDAPTLSGAPTSYKNTATAVTISFNSSETSPVFSYSINGGTTWSAYSATASYTFSSQVNGTTYRIKVRQKDQAGNISTDSSEVSWTVDTSAPSAPSVAQLVTPTLDTSASISFTAAETGGSAPV
ncbi:MAG: hypothetical protein EBU51_05535 [Synechococcaceae bacterium WB6_3A_227]|nr:hypothetical protein [Synechococcaceae bacterium WB6_3A_227]